MKELVVIALALWLSFQKADVQGYSYQDEYSLRAKLRESYDDTRRPMLPRFSSTETVRVNMGMALIKILNFDEESGVISVYAWERLAWTDLFLTWNPDDYDGIDILYLPIDHIWRPDLILYNRLTIESERGDTRTLAVVQHTGYVLYIPHAIYTVYCTPDEVLARWSCPFKFGSWVYDGFKLDVDFYDNNEQIDLTDMIQDKRYAVVGHQAKKNVKYYPCCDEPYPDLTFTLEIQRNETSGCSGPRGGLISALGLVIIMYSDVY